MPISASGAATPGTAPGTIAPPSSSADSIGMPRLREQLRDHAARPARRPLPRRCRSASEERALGREALGEQPLDRLEDGKQARLVVERAAAPDEAVGDHAVEGRMLPLRFGPRLDRHDVLVGEQQQRRQLGIPTLPRVEQAGAPDELRRERRVRARIAAREVAAERRELRARRSPPDPRARRCGSAGRRRAGARPRRRRSGATATAARLRPPRGEDRGADPDHREQQQERGEHALADALHAEARCARARPVRFDFVRLRLAARFACGARRADASPGARDRCGRARRRRLPRARAARAAPRPSPAGCRGLTSPRAFTTRCQGTSLSGPRLCSA